MIAMHPLAKKKSEPPNLLAAQHDGVQDRALCSLALPRVGDVAETVLGTRKRGLCGNRQRAVCEPEDRHVLR